MESSELAKQEKLSKKRIWISTLLGFFIPFTPYLYTQRWKALLWYVGLGFAIAFVMEFVAPSRDLEESFERGANWSGVASIVSITDNWLAISRARKKINPEKE